MVVKANFSTSTGTGVGEGVDIVVFMTFVEMIVETALGAVDFRIAGALETAGTGIETGLATEGALDGAAVLLACLKKGRERFPQPGMLTSQPLETIRRSINIAEKMERLLKVSRKVPFLVSV